MMNYWKTCANIRKGKKKVDYHWQSATFAKPKYKH